MSFAKFLVPEAKIKMSFALFLVPEGKIKVSFAKFPVPEGKIKMSFAKFLLPEGEIKMSFAPPQHGRTKANQLRHYSSIDYSANKRNKSVDRWESSGGEMDDFTHDKERTGYLVINAQPSKVKVIPG